MLKSDPAIDDSQIVVRVELFEVVDEVLEVLLSLVLVAVPRVFILRNVLLHDVHRLLEAVHGQLAIVLHVHQKARLHNWLRQHIQLIFVKVLLHDLFGGLVFNGSVVGPVACFFQQFVTPEDDSLRKFLIEHLQFVGHIAITSTTFCGSTAFLLLLFLRLTVVNHLTLVL